MNRKQCISKNKTTKIWKEETSISNVATTQLNKKNINMNTDNINDKLVPMIEVHYRILNVAK